MKTLAILFSALFATAAFAADTPAQPAVTVTATATASVANDRMIAWLRVEADNPDPGKAAAEVNGRMAKALARAKGTAGVEVSTSGYSSWQVYDKNQPNRWRVTQTMTLEGTDFATMAALVSRLQADDQLLLSGMNFAVSREARQRAEDALTQQAIKAWQARAQNAARGFGFDAWRTGRVTVQTGEPIRPIPMMRMQAAAPAAGGAPPVNVEGGNTDVTVTVTGEALLEGKR
ncbi:MAG: SIMPL domain-containing protein [Burkholderiales bacterium]|nr:SIMPL domain-containing protein [Burkholderiales bacterium]